MTVAAWPASVPFRYAPPFTIRGAEGAFLETRFDKGPAQRRRVTSANTGLVDVVLPALTPEEYGALDQWHDSVLGAGTFAFEMTNPLTGLLRVWSFASPISVSDVGPKWRRVEFALNLHTGLT